MKKQIVSLGKKIKTRYENVVSVSDLQKDLFRTLNEVGYTKQRTLVTKRGKVFASIEPISEKESGDLVVVPPKTRHLEGKQPG